LQALRFGASVLKPDLHLQQQINANLWQCRAMTVETARFGSRFPRAGYDPPVGSKCNLACAWVTSLMEKNGRGNNRTADKVISSERAIERRTL
jgi:hypothetical protein